MITSYHILHRAITIGEIWTKVIINSSLIPVQISSDREVPYKGRMTNCLLDGSCPWRLHSEEIETGKLQDQVYRRDRVAVL